ncbi:MAG TPA: ABC transporter ATP-binding protein [Thermodesulfobacteriota bacterium]|nr:ABC transporter ATP-binding protein [Thermodesulfobacteriota bacterium]
MLKVQGIETYYGNIKALKGVDLEVPAGSIVSILGVNGAGKTTLLKTIAGLLKPRSGTIHFMEKDITSLKAHQVVRGGIALVPEGRAILAKMTVLENLEMGAYHRRDDQVKKDLEKEFDRFPWLKDRRDQAGGSLSGGEQQMLAISRALLAGPRLLLLDEPSLGLAPLVVAGIFQTIKSINKAGTTVLLVEQNVRQAMKVSHFAYVLETGRIVLKGPSEELLKESKIKEAFLGQRG